MNEIDFFGTDAQFEALRSVLSDAGFEWRRRAGTSIECGTALIEWHHEHSCRATLLALASRCPESDRIVIVPPDDVGAALEAMRHGATHVVASNAPAELRGILAELVESLDEVHEADHPLIGSSAATVALKDAISRASSRTAAPVLIHGESGTGKERVAELLHSRSPRRDAPFVIVDCASIPENLLEAHLFGHERGAFTGASERRLGLCELAGAGTLFLDEIGELPLSLQAKLLRLLEVRTFRRVGGKEAIPFEARVVAATHRNLEEEVAADRFREDLRYRLEVLHIDVPALRDRNGDVLVLAQHFIAEFADRNDAAMMGLDPLSKAALRAHSWPGNVRELRNVIERAVALYPGARTLRIEHLPARLLSRLESSTEGAAQAETQEKTEARRHAWHLPDAGVRLDDVERELIEQALERTGFVQTRAAALLGISRFSLRHRIDRLGLSPRLVHKSPPKADQ